MQYMAAIFFIIKDWCNVLHAVKVLLHAAPLVTCNICNLPVKNESIFLAVKPFYIYR